LLFFSGDSDHILGLLILLFEVTYWTRLA